MSDTPEFYEFTEEQIRDISVTLEGRQLFCYLTGSAKFSDIEICELLEMPDGRHRYAMYAYICYPNEDYVPSGNVWTNIYSGWGRDTEFLSSPRCHPQDMFFMWATRTLVMHGLQPLSIRTAGEVYSEDMGFIGELAGDEELVFPWERLVRFRNLKRRPE